MYPNKEMHFTFNEKFYLIPFGIWMFFVAVSRTFYMAQDIFQNSHRWIYFICCLIVFIKEVSLIKTYKKKDWMLLIIAFFLVFILFHLSKIAMICLVFFIYTGRNIEFNKIVYVTIWAFSLGFLFTTLGQHFGFIPNFIYPGKRIRETMGFTCALYPPGLFFIILSAHIYVRKENITYLELIIELLITILLFIKCNSRTSFILSIALICIAALLKGKTDTFKKDSKLLNLLPFILIFMYIFSFVVAWQFNIHSPFQRHLNILLSHRLIYAHNALMKYGITAFGKNIIFIGGGLNAHGEFVAGKYDYVDNVFQLFTQWYGYIFMGICIVLYTVILHKAKTKKDSYFLILVSIIAVHAFMEETCFHVFYNPFLFSLSYLMEKNVLFNGNSV